MCRAYQETGKRWLQSRSSLGVGLLLFEKQVGVSAGFPKAGPPGAHKAAMTLSLRHGEGGLIYEWCPRLRRNHEGSTVLLEDLRMGRKGWMYVLSTYK